MALVASCSVFPSRHNTSPGRHSIQVYTERFALLSRPPIYPNYNLKGLSARNLTPPYLSNIAEVMDVALLQFDDARWLLILALDGLAHILSLSEDVWDLLTAAELQWCAAAVSTGSGAGNMVDYGLCRTIALSYSSSFGFNSNAAVHAASQQIDKTDDNVFLKISCGSSEWMDG
ncbi:hypothetical protein B0H14DRAFT_2591855 [Mycena olivaceomarginata]|nr:hypothetical protein B0H14DRAFT_2591855 [Mycena olivaceomarginata]